MVLRGKHPAGNGRNRFFFFFFFVEVVLRVMGIAKLDCAWLQFSGIPPIPSRTCNRFGKVNHPRVAPEARLCAVIFASTSCPRVVRRCLAADGNDFFERNEFGYFVDSRKKKREREREKKKERISNI